MNWLQKISSFNIRFTDEIEQDIQEITKTVLNYYLNKNKEPLVMWRPFDPYLKQQRAIKIAILPTSKSKDQIARYNSEKQEIYIFPYNLLLETSEINDKNLFSAFYQGVVHEVAHALDPKFKLNSKHPIKDTNQYEYYSSPIEFDGYSKQIAEYLKKEIDKNEDTKPIVEDWLRNDILKPDNPLIAYDQSLMYWAQSDQENKTDYIRRFKLRIYNKSQY